MILMLFDVKSTIQKQKTRVRLPRRAVAAKSFVQSSYTTTPGSMDIATGPNGACVDEVIFQAS